VHELADCIDLKTVIQVCQDSTIDTETINTIWVAETGGMESKPDCD